MAGTKTGLIYGGHSALYMEHSNIAVVNLSDPSHCLILIYSPISRPYRVWVMGVAKDEVHALRCELRGSLVAELSVLALP